MRFGLAVAFLGAAALVVATAVVLRLRWLERQARERVTIAVEEADLRDVMDAVAKHVGTNIVVEPDVHERVSVSLRDIPWREAVDTIARITKCEIVAKENVILLSQPPRVTIQDIDSLDVRSALSMIASDAGVRVVFADDVKGPCPLLEIYNVRWWPAFQKVCEEAGLTARREDGIIFVSSGR